MQDEHGNNVELYTPRKCSWTNRLLTATDHASVQINVAKVNPETGLFTKECDVFAVSGYLRMRGEADMAISTLSAKKDGEVVV